MFSKVSIVSVEKIRDFYRFSKVTKWIGETTGKETFGSGIHLENKNEAIMLYYGNKWAYVSIENEKVIFQYTENKQLFHFNNCPITENKNEILIISKIILEWYNKLGLPKSITEFELKMNSSNTVNVVKEIEINIFNDIATLNILNDGTANLIFNFFPPDKNTLTKYQIKNFEKILSKAINKKVIHEDRELFIILDDSEEMINDLICFLNNL